PSLAAARPRPPAARTVALRDARAHPGPPQPHAQSPRDLAHGDLARSRVAPPPPPPSVPPVHLPGPPAPRRHHPPARGGEPRPLPSLLPGPPPDPPPRPPPSRPRRPRRGRRARPRRAPGRRCRCRGRQRHGLHAREHASEAVRTVASRSSAPGRGNPPRAAEARRRLAVAAAGR